MQNSQIKNKLTSVVIGYELIQQSRFYSDLISLLLCKTAEIILFDDVTFNKLQKFY